MPKVMELLTFQHPIKNPVDLNLRGFQYGGRGRNRTGVGGFAIRCITILLLGHLQLISQKNIRNKRKFNHALGCKHLILQQFRLCLVLMARIMYQNTDAGNPLNSNNF